MDIVSSSIFFNIYNKVNCQQSLRKQAVVGMKFFLCGSVMIGNKFLPVVNINVLDMFGSVCDHTRFFVFFSLCHPMKL